MRAAIGTSEKEEKPWKPDSRALPIPITFERRSVPARAGRGYTSDTMQIVLTATRHDVAMISEGRFTQPPDYVVVARIVMTTKGALELAEAIKSTVAKHQAMPGRLHSSSGHA